MLYYQDVEDPGKRKFLKNFAATIFSTGLGSLLVGCEENFTKTSKPTPLDEFDRYDPIPEGTADARGTWYKPADGEWSNGNWGWGWVHLWLRQSGTSLRGKYKLEKYSSHIVSGEFLDEKTLHLDVWNGTDNPNFADIDGEVVGNTMFTNYSFVSSIDGRLLIIQNKFNLATRDYGKRIIDYPAFHLAPINSSLGGVTESDLLADEHLYLENILANQK
jgi:hypothetical protein